MIQFTDRNGATVRLLFKRNAFSQVANHVLVLCKFKDKWLLTKHKQRGREFPGGKREDGETLEEAAKREVFEETGAIIKELHFVGEYEVINNDTTFVKAIFFAFVTCIEEQGHYFETDGPILISDEELRVNRMSTEYSFIMQDDVVWRSIEQVDHLLTSENHLQ